MGVYLVCLSYCRWVEVLVLFRCCFSVGMVGVRIWLNCYGGFSSSMLLLLSCSGELLGWISSLVVSIEWIGSVMVLCRKCRMLWCCLIGN